MDVHDDWKTRKEKELEVDLGLHGFDTEQTLACLSLFPCPLARTGKGDEVHVGDGFLQVLNILVPGSESPQGD